MIAAESKMVAATPSLTTPPVAPYIADEYKKNSIADFTILTLPLLLIEFKKNIALRYLNGKKIN